MSAEQPTDPATAPSASSTPSAASAPAPVPGPAPAGIGERRGLLIILTAVEFVLTLLPLLVPVVAAPTPVTGEGGPPCEIGGGGPGGPTVIDTCQTGNGSSQALALIAILCVLLSVLVLPVVIGALSRRWQTAVALPSAPFWILTLLLGFIAMMSRFNNTEGSAVTDALQAYSQIFSLLFATPMILMVLIAGSLGALAWLARRGLAR